MTKYNKWQSKVDALIRLAEDQRGKPEGDLARQKLTEIVNKHPAARNYAPLLDLAQRDLTMADVRNMRRNGISTAGSWEGDDLRGAILAMQADYKRRIAEHNKQKEMIETGSTPLLT